MYSTGNTVTCNTSTRSTYDRTFDLRPTQPSSLLPLQKHGGKACGLLSTNFEGPQMNIYRTVTSALVWVMSRPTPRICMHMHTVCSYQLRNPRFHRSPTRAFSILPGTCIRMLMERDIQHPTSTISTSKYSSFFAPNSNSTHTWAWWYVEREMGLTRVPVVVVVRTASCIGLAVQ